MADLTATRWSESLQGRWPQGELEERTDCLVCIYPPERLGSIAKLTDREFVIGRDSACDLELPDESVSRRHAVLRPAMDCYLLIDVGSTNGTYVNEMPISAQRIESGDRLRFGNQIFKFLSTDRFEAEFFETAYRFMTTDGLTQIYNKRYLMEVADRELRRASRANIPFSVLMIDVDYFKSINDDHGHLVGDEVLIELARRLRSVLRGGEVLGRYGGEEFCLLLPDTGQEEARQTGERLRAVVAERSFRYDGKELAVTVSIGAATAEPAAQMTATQTTATQTTAADLMAAADVQLYAAKRAGRNRVCVGVGVPAGVQGG
ncbi:MAG TPA: GGDEF domain-containing protein [Pirellulales bacterium]|nr:GGDEF domain-containing protein [Pirellulales bacterium]